MSDSPSISLSLPRKKVKAEKFKTNGVIRMTYLCSKCTMYEEITLFYLKTNHNKYSGWF